MLRIKKEVARELLSNAIGKLFAEYKLRRRHYNEAMAAYNALPWWRRWWRRWFRQEPTAPAAVYYKDELVLAQARYRLRDHHGAVIQFTTKELACIFKHYQDKDDE